MNLEWTSLSRVRIILGSLAFVCALLYPFAYAPVPDAPQQICGLVLFSTAALLFGLGVLPWRVNAVWFAMLVLMAIVPTTYLGARVQGLAGLLLLGIGGQLGVGLGRKPEHLRYYLLALTVAAFVDAVQGLLQWFGLVGDLQPWVIETMQRGLAFGVLRQTNLFATFTCLGIVSCIWLVYLQRLTEAMAWFLCVVMVFAVAASRSRVGGLELFVLALLGFFWRRSHSGAITRLLIGQSFLFLLATVLLPIAAELHGFGSSTAVQRMGGVGADPRLVIWSNALELIRERPWWGWGWQETEYAHYVTLIEHRFSGVLNHVHNWPLQMAIDIGVPLTVVFVGLVLRAIYKLKPWRLPSIERASQNQVSGRQFAWIILLLVVGMHGMLEYPLSYARFLFITGVAVGLVSTPVEATETNKTYRKWAKIWGTANALGLIVIGGVAASQYALVIATGRTPFNDKAAKRAALVRAQPATLFKGQLDFSTLAQVEVTQANAQEIRIAAERAMHYTTSPKIIVPLLNSLIYLQDKDAFSFQVVRFCQAFPSSYLEWKLQHVNSPWIKGAEQFTRTCEMNAPPQPGS